MLKTIAKTAGRIAGYTVAAGVGLFLLLVAITSIRGFFDLIADVSRAIIDLFR